MILIRDVFQLKFGKAKEAIALWKEGAAIAEKAGFGPVRALTDLTGPFYTFVLEGTFENFAHYEERREKLLGSEEWREWYQKFASLLQSGSRQIFKIVE